MNKYMTEKDEWYTEYYQSPLEKQYELMIDLFKNPPEDKMLIEDDLGIALVDLKAGLYKYKKFDEANHLIDAVKENTSAFFMNEANYLCDAPVEYFLYKNDIEKVKYYLESYLENPVKAVGLFIRLFYRLLFYQQNELAVQTAAKVWGEIQNSSEIIDGVECEFTEIIFYNYWHEYYKTLITEDSIKADSILGQIREFSNEVNGRDDFIESVIDRNENSMREILEKAGKPVFTMESWTRSVQSNSNGSFKQLYWSFATYILSEKKMPFTVSHIIWGYFVSVLSKNKDLGIKFQFESKDLKKIMLDIMGDFLSREEEIGFMFLWGIPYIYDFLEEQRLVTAEDTKKALEKVNQIKREILRGYGTELWRFDFVHVLDKPDCISNEEFTEEQRLFEESFTAPVKIKEKTLRPLSKHSVIKSEQLSLFDDLLSEPVDRSNNSSVTKAQKKNKRKAAKKQRMKNRKK